MKELEKEIQKELLKNLKKEKEMNNDFLNLHRSDRKAGDFPYIDAQEFEKKTIFMGKEKSDRYYEKIFIKILEKFGS